MSLLGGVFLLLPTDSGSSTGEREGKKMLNLRSAGAMLPGSTGVLQCFSA